MFEVRVDDKGAHFIAVPDFDAENRVLWPGQPARNTSLVVLQRMRGARSRLEEDFDCLSPQWSVARWTSDDVPRRLEPRGLARPGEGGASDERIRRVLRRRGVEIPPRRIEAPDSAMRLGAE